MRFCRQNLTSTLAALLTFCVIGRSAAEGVRRSISTERPVETRFNCISFSHQMTVSIPTVFWPALPEFSESVAAPFVLSSEKQPSEFLLCVFPTVAIGSLRDDEKTVGVIANEGNCIEQKVEVTDVQALSGEPHYSCSFTGIKCEPCSSDDLIRTEMTSEEVESKFFSASFDVKAIEPYEYETAIDMASIDPEINQNEGDVIVVSQSPENEISSAEEKVSIETETMKLPNVICCTIEDLSARALNLVNEVILLAESERECPTLSLPTQTDPCLEYSILADNAVSVLIQERELQDASASRSNQVVLPATEMDVMSLKNYIGSGMNRLWCIRWRMRAAEKKGDTKEIERLDKILNRTLWLIFAAD